jgi:hypothetical protein
MKDLTNPAWPALDKLEKPVYQELSDDSSRMVSEWAVRPLSQYPLCDTCPHALLHAVRGPKENLAGAGRHVACERSCHADF